MSGLIDISSWKDKVSNHSQVGGIETSILDDGKGRNTRIAWINTGSGLRYKVVIDRGLDIVDAFYNQHSLAWLSHGGVMAPQEYAHQGFEWLKSFSGGLMTTCGLTHIGGPEEDEYGTRGLHDQVSNIPASLESIVQPNLHTGAHEISLSGSMKQTQVFGHRVELKRKITSQLGSSAITVKDVVTNAGNEPVPHMVLYHLNFGWPLIDQDTRLLWKGVTRSRGGEMDDQLFGEGKDFKTCKPPLAEHAGTGEACGFIDPIADQEGKVLSGVYNKMLGLVLTVSFKKRQMPSLTNWQHWGPHEYVTALEPGTHPPIGQAAARKENTLIFLEPGESRTYDLEMEVLTDTEKIKDFISKTETAANPT